MHGQELETEELLPFHCWVEEMCQSSLFMSVGEI